MSSCDESCAAFTCQACGAHVHPSDYYHWESECEPSIRRRVAEHVAEFVDELNAATAAIGPTGVVHDVQCQAVRAHITRASSWEWASVNWMPWKVIRGSVTVGKRCQMCSPPVTIQARPRRLLVRLTGIGWPGSDGRCTKGHLPLWAKEAD